MLKRKFQCNAQKAGGNSQQQLPITFVILNCWKDDDRVLMLGILWPRVEAKHPVAGTPWAGTRRRSRPKARIAVLSLMMFRTKPLRCLALVWFPFLFSRFFLFVYVIACHWFSGLYMFIYTDGWMHIRCNNNFKRVLAATYQVNGHFLSNKTSRQVQLYFSVWKNLC
jgi:hypothetical protein